jgi:tetrahydromethanopterin S-methyltransferase subunit H
MLHESTNNLLDPSEQAHIAAVRGVHGFPTLSGQHANAWDWLKHTVANLDYNKMFEQFAVAVTAAHIIYAVIKLSKYITVLGWESANEITTILMMLMFLAVALLAGKHNHGILLLMAMLTITAAQTI